MNWSQYIVSDKEILLGKPTIKGTRISVEHIIALKANAWTEQQILDNYPSLTIDALHAVFSYIQACIKDNLLYAESLA